MKKRYKLHTERWKFIKGYDKKYMVSNTGFIKSFHKEEVFLKKYVDLHGYETINLYLNGKCIKCAVHRLVAEAFISNPENKSQVNHIDEDKINNNSNNLEWVTPKENMNHSQTGDKHPRSKLTNEEVEQMRELHIEDPKKFNSIRLAEMFNIGKTQAFRIIKKEQRFYEK
ncbi:NUMOD4 domain-containing protein [Paenibacillus sp. WLX2291]|uniref:NUMOD4 domain-containing protein n=1 Tax=Paenibacillus sp. WLX2291 TaxID=3296934 RepID=UPI003983ED70